MSIEFEIENGDRFLMVDAYGTDAVVLIDSTEGEDGTSGASGRFESHQMRQLRRFLEYCYPASEDPPHGPDPWEPRS